ncbi:MAG: alpha/beta hydrolase [Vicinamibacterales bacterium]
MLREIQGPAGRLEVLLDMPASRGVTSEGLVATGADQGVRAAVVLGHPHPQFGGTMHTKGNYHTAKGLSRIGCAVLRFNFRGVGKSEGVYDEGVGERDDFRAALDYMAERFPGVPLWAGGMSFGSWVALNVGVWDPRVSLLLGVATPVTKWDFTNVETSTKPKFFIHGELDEICGFREINAFYARCADPKELIIIDTSDHLFNGVVGEVADAVEELLADWFGEPGADAGAEDSTHD